MYLCEFFSSEVQKYVYHIDTLDQRKRNHRDIQHPQINRNHTLGTRTCNDIHTMWFYNAKTTRCTHCFSLTQMSNDCEWASDPPSVPQPAVQSSKATSDFSVASVTNGTVLQVHAWWLAAPTTMYLFNNPSVATILLYTTRLTRASTAPLKHHAYSNIQCGWIH